MSVMELIVMGIKNALFTEICNQNYSFLKYLCKKFKEGITVEEVFSTDKFYYGAPDVQIYYDLYAILCDDMDSRQEEYISAYVDYYRQKYVRQYNKIQSLELDKINIYEYANKFINNGFEYAEAFPSFQMVVFLLRVKDDRELNRRTQELDFHCLAGNIPDKLYIRQCITILLDEKNYDIYIKTCRKKLSKDIGISESKLNKHFYDKLTKGINPSVLCLPKDSFYAAVQTMIANNNGGTNLYDTSLVLDKNNRKRKLKFVPDINTIIASFYESKIASFAILPILAKHNDETLRKLPADDLLRFLLIKQKNTGDKESEKLLEVFESANGRQWASFVYKKEDETEILKLAAVNVVHHLFDYTLKKLYEVQFDRLFNDVPSGNQSVESNKIGSLKEQIKTLKEKNEILINKNQDIKTKYLKLKSQEDERERFEEEFARQTVEALKEDRELDRELYEKQALLDEMKLADEQRYETEMERLRCLIEERDQLIEGLLSDKNTGEETKISLDDLYLYRYLFVGNLSICGFQELKYKFPNSIFFERESQDIKNASVDYIVMMTASMSHKLYYRLDSFSNLRSIPRIYYNGKTIAGLLNEMAAQIYSLSEGNGTEV